MRDELAREVVCVLAIIWAEVGEDDVYEQRGRQERCAVEAGDRSGELLFLRGGQRAGVLDLLGPVRIRVKGREDVEEIA